MASHKLIYYNSIIIITSFTLLCYFTKSQQPYGDDNCPVHDNATSALGYTCNGAHTSCQSYLIYRTQPPYTTISSIASLLSANASEISAINNNISANKAAFATNVEVIVPTTCSCSGRYYQANTTHVVQTGDTYFMIANNIFRGLTTCNAIRDQKSSRDIVNLLLNETLTIPLRCACPTTRQVNEGVRYVMSFVIQEGSSNNISTIAQQFGGNNDQILEANELSQQNYSSVGPWTTLLVPLQQPPNGSQITYTYHHNNRSSNFYAFVVAVPAALAILLLIGACFFAYYLKNKISYTPDLEEFNAVESLRFEFRTIRNATNDFSQNNKLGQGGFGVVYKGILPSGQEIAVKRLSLNSGQGIREFKTEVVLLEKLQHNNLVKLLGFCLHREEKLLVYELLPNASLDKILLDQNRQSSLDWETRYKILLGTARGLLYLHEDSRLKIIHRDLKPSNILLDENMSPKISDFGLARLVGRDQIQADTSKIAGTYGYMAPEYALAGRFSIMSDVYSFGVIALEVISGHMCRSTTFPFEDESLCLRAWRLWKGGAISELVDPRLNGSYISDEVTKCIHIGLLCIQEEAKKRPIMATIVSALCGYPVVLLQPEPPSRRPLINIKRKLFVENLKSSEEDSFNKDDITEIHPR